MLRMVDSRCCSLVDAFEEPITWARFVTRKALALGLRPILVVNKIDRDGCDLPHGTINEVFDLFCNLGATDAASSTSPSSMHRGGRVLPCSIRPTIARRG